MKLVSALLLLLAPVTFFLGYEVESYILIYISIVVFLALSTFIIKNSIKVVMIFLLFYLGVGLLNISSWRGYISLEVIYMYAWAVYIFALPVLVLASSFKFIDLKQIRFQGDIKKIIFCHVFVTYLACAVVFVLLGNIVSQPTLRFDIPTALEYIIKSGLPIMAVIPLIRYRYSLLVGLAIILPAVLIGSRGTAVVAILAHFIVLVNVENKRLDIIHFFRKNKKMIVYFAIAGAVIAGGFFLRRTSGQSLAPTQIILNTYFDYDNIFVWMILPFYLGFKETIGITSLIINNDIENTINGNFLFFADLITVLPGEDLAAGQTIAQMFGRTQGGGLTPGLLGGLYIDFGIAALLGFLVFGFLMVFIEKKLVGSPYFIIIYAQVLTQFIHLFHRGFMKPEYITAVIIAVFYYYLSIRGSKFKGQNSKGRIR